jgi:hypothetical protein
VGKPSTPGVFVALRPSKTERSSIRVMQFVDDEVPIVDTASFTDVSSESWTSEEVGLVGKKALPNSKRMDFGSLMIESVTRRDAGRETLVGLVNFFRAPKRSPFISDEQNVFQLSSLERRRRRWYLDLR